jgi:GNAT superfamily N-acetyltransferase
MSGITIRPGTAGDLEALVALHEEGFAAEENIVTALGDDAVRAAYRWLLKDPGAVVLVAEEDGLPVGFTSLVDRPYTRSLLLYVLPHALRAIVRRPRLMVDPVLRARLRRLFRSGDAPLPDGAHIAYTAVAPGSRGRGVGGRLKDASIEWCRDRGIERMITGVHESNEPSRRMNERAGFAEVPELRRGDMLIYVLPIGPVAEAADE